MSNEEMSPAERAFQNARAGVRMTYPSAYALTTDRGVVIAGAGPLLHPWLTEREAWIAYAQWINETPARIATMEAEAKASLGILAFERDTQIELAKQLAKHWVIAHLLRTKHLPNGAVFYAYPIGWGEADNGPMHGKRVVISLEIENEASHD